MIALIQQFENTSLLITVDHWFIAPDGKQYRAVWGKVKVYNAEQALGIKVNSRSADWYAAVGEGDSSMIVAGCQIHYACVCPNKPNTEQVHEQRIDGPNVTSYLRDNQIYLAQ